MRHGDETRMPRPERPHLSIQRNCFLDRFIAHRIATFDRGTSDRGGFKRDHRIVTAKFRIDGAPDRAEIVMHFAGPIRRAVDGPAIAEQRASRIERCLHVLEVALHMEDRGPGEAPRMRFVGTREATLEEDRRGLGHERDAIADLAQPAEGRVEGVGADAERRESLRGAAHGGASVVIQMRGSRADFDEAEAAGENRLQAIKDAPLVKAAGGKADRPVARRFSFRVVNHGSVADCRRNGQRNRCPLRVRTGS